MADITMPQLGETVTEGTIIGWFKQVGDSVALDETLFEVSTDKVDTEVPSPVSGVLTEIIANEGDLVEVGQVLARVGEPGKVDAPASGPVAQADQPDADEHAGGPQPLKSEAAPFVSNASDVAARAPSGQIPPQRAPSVKASSGGAASGAVLSPIVRRLIAESGIEASSLTGSGVGGRITRADVEKAIRARAASAAPDTAAQRRSAAPAARPPQRRSTAPARTGAAEDPAVKLSNIRRRTAEHMVMSKRVSPHVLTAVEVDYEGVERVRLPLRAAWKQQEGFSLTYLPFIARAVIDALREFPHLNASFSDDGLIVHRAVNLAIAVDLDFQGLLAPVIRGAEGKRLRQIARDIADVAARARSRRLSPDELSAGTFTITNAGQYGTMMQFPIINQPQVAILSTDGISRKPVVVTDAHGAEAVAVHSVGVLAMAWDHRAFDGAYAAAFLHTVRRIIETRDWETEVR